MTIDMRRFCPSRVIGPMGPHEIVLVDVVFRAPGTLKRETVRDVRICRRCYLKDTYIEEGSP